MYAKFNFFVYVLFITKKQQHVKQRMERGGDLATCITTSVEKITH